MNNANMEATEMVDCNFAHALTSHWLYHLAQYLHIGTSLITLVAIILIPYRHRKIQLLNSSTKLLLYMLFFFTLLHSIVLGAFQSFHVIRDFSIATYCDLYIPSRVCCVFRIPFTFSIAGLVITWFGCAVERLIASLNPGIPDRQLHMIGSNLLVIVVAITSAITLWVFWDEDMEELQINCGASTLKTAWKFTIFFYALMAVDLISVFMFIGLYLANNYVVAKNYKLRDRFQVQENLKMIRLISPIVIAHFIVFAFYTISTVIVQGHKEDFKDQMLYTIIDLHCYVVPYFTICLPFLFAFIVWRSERARRQKIDIMVNTPSGGEVGADIYFSTFNAMWTKAEK